MDNSLCECEPCTTKRRAVELEAHADRANKLQEQVDWMAKRIAELEAALTICEQTSSFRHCEITRLRVALRKLEWYQERSESPGVEVTHYCPVCGECLEDGDGHDGACWLDEELKMTAPTCDHCGERKATILDTPNPFFEALPELLDGGINEETNWCEECYQERLSDI